MQRIVIHLILIAIVFAVFMFANASRISNRGVKQQVLQKEIALMIDSAVPGMVLEIEMIHKNGEINNIELEDSKVFVTVDNLKSYKGYPYFSRYDVNVDILKGKFRITVDEK